MNNRVVSLIIIGLCLLSIIVGTINTVVVANKAPAPAKVSSETGFWNFTGGEDKIALIKLQGEISSETSGGFLGDLNSADAVKKALRRAYTDESVKGILLYIDSPGGTVAMSQEINNLLLRLRTKMPVVVSMSDLAASGGYYIASAADRIFAEPGTLTGSIGVIMNFFDAHELLNQKLGVKSTVIKSGKYKDIASPYRSITSDERNLLQNLVNSTYKQFLNAIIAGRVNRSDTYKEKKTPLSAEILKKYADGRIFTGEQAQKLGFVDQIGGLYDAQEAINRMAIQKFGLSSKEELPIVQYNMPTGLNEFLFSASEMLGPKKDLTSTYIPLSAKYPHQPLFVWE